MADREKIKEELRQEIEELEKELEEKKLLCKPEMIPGFGGSKIVLGSPKLRQEMDVLKKEIERKRNLLLTYESNLIGKHESVPKVDREALLLPEYRTGGYFTSQDYYDKCDEFHKILEEHGEDFLNMSRSEYIFLKKEFFRNTYGITWLSEEEQFLPGVVKEVHVSHPRN